MEKISGILASSPRVTAVDMKDVGPVRPGTPSFGRPEQASMMKAPPNFGTTASKSAAVQLDQQDWRTKDAQRAMVAAEVSDKFFNKIPVNKPSADMPMARTMEAPRSNPMFMPEVASSPAGFKTDEVGNFRATSALRPSMSEFEDEAEELKQPEGLYPRGTFIDRTA